MSFNKSIIIVLLACAIAGRAYAQQTQTDTSTVSRFRMVIEIGGGYSYKITEPKQTLGTYTRDGISGTIRLKWGTSALLGVGIETGWMPISGTTNSSLASEFGPVDLKASLTAIPLLALFSLQRFGVQLHSGIGYYRVNSRVTVGGSTNESSEWDLGFMVALGYARPVLNEHRLGVEIKYNNITEQQVSTVSVHIRFLYRLF
jgi:Outer membrane protein beta-barrel domain